eukprot:759493-Alexandrium_andersonii.AAC.1
MASQSGGVAGEATLRQRPHPSQAGEGGSEVRAAVTARRRGLARREAGLKNGAHQLHEHRTRKAPPAGGDLQRPEVARGLRPGGLKDPNEQVNRLP